MINKPDILSTVKQIIISFCLIVYSQLAISQNQLKGKVINEETKEPISLVSVYLNNTTNGSVTDKDGIFYIKNMQPGKYKLVASSVGYITYTKMVDTRSTNTDLTITLKVKADELQSVDVVSYDPEGWEKWGKLFTDLFIGTNPNAIICRLMNPEVIQFRMNRDNTLSAIAKKPLKIENDALGYEILYKLETFEYDFNKRIVSYSGYALFRDLSETHPGRAEKYARKREETYDGSLMQFMRAFFMNKLELNGYEMRSSPSHPLISSDSIGFAADSNTAGFYFQDSLEITYTHKVIPNAYKRLSTAHKNETFPVSRLLFINKRPVFIISSGYYYGPEDLKITGFWAWWETTANMLPYDYWPEKAN
ncbi:MAG TPA: carboxypeptidase-like regulatory domain-containing protein [Puia sp.]|nr:carboxypeptidase-like regulatory domain-containing protein [Puia sp.]